MARGRLGRPPLPEDERKRTITVYVGARVVERIDHRAARDGLSRNQVIAAVLANHFDALDGDQANTSQVVAAARGARS